MAQSLFARQLPFRRSVLGQLSKELASGYLVVVLVSSAPVDRYVRGSFEKERAQVTDSPRLVQTQESYVGFLGDFERLVVRSDPPPQEANQGLVVFTKQSLNHLGPRFLVIGLGVSDRVGVGR